MKVLSLLDMERMISTFIPLKMKFLATAATGAQGTGVVHYCLQAGHDVYALVRNPSSEKAQNLQRQGAKLVRGDFDDVDSLHVAMQGMEGVFLNLPSQLGVEAARNVVSAARAAPTISVMIASTVIKAGEHESFPRWGPDWSMREYWLTKDEVEKCVREAGFQNWVIVRPARLMQNFLLPEREIYYPGFDKDGVFRVAFSPQTQIAWLDARDVGIVAVVVLSEPYKYTTRHIDLAGECLSIQEYASKVGDFLGTASKVHYYTEVEIAQVPYRIVRDAEIWTSEVPSSDAVLASKEFGLTSVEQFLKDHELLLK